MIINLSTKRIQVISQQRTFIGVLPTRWRRKPVGRDAERNYVTVTGATENARHENTGRSKMQGWKMRDMNLRHQNARVENAGKVSMESQSVKKCLKVVVFVCRVIPSV